MPAYLIEPTDVLFFRDGIPMSAGMGKGHGCRLPFPSTLHEGFRASLLKHTSQEVTTKGVRGRDHKLIATKAFSSMRSAGPLPWHKDHGVLLPVPLDATFNKEKTCLHRLELLVQSCPASPSDVFHPACLPVATTPPDKHGALSGWWTIAQYQAYLQGGSTHLQPVPTDELWRAEHRIGVQIDPGSFAAAEGQLFAGSFMRSDEKTRIFFDADLRDSAAATNGEGGALETIHWLLLGGEQRIARLHPEKTDLLQAMRRPPVPTQGDGPVLLKWVLITPAIFAHGSLPGWCSHPAGKPDGLPIGRVRLGASRRKVNNASAAPLPGKAALASWCLGRPQTVTGWDNMEQQAKPTQLAVPAGSVFYFLCENAATATALAQKLHWQPRSDHYGEKGCGYGLVSFDVRLHSTSPDIRHLTDTLFKA